MNRMTVRQAASRLGVADSTIYLLCSKGLLQHIRIGAGRGTIRIPEDALTANEASRTVKGPPADAPPLFKHIRV